MMEITRKDLEKLNDIYWWLDRQGEEYSDGCGLLSKIYFFCAGKLNEASVVNQDDVPIYESIRFDAVLTEEDTTLLTAKQKRT